MKNKTLAMAGIVASLAVGLTACYVPAPTDTKARPNDRGTTGVEQPSVEEIEGLSAGTGTASEKPSAKPVAKTQAQELKDCIAKTGTGSEKAAAKHITKVTGAANGETFAMAEVFTDYSGDLFSGEGSKGKLIASAFASCYKSDDGNSGLVMVYNKDGEILSDGNY